MRFLKNLKKKREKIKIDFHKNIVPLLFVTLWIAGLLLTIISPNILPYKEGEFRIIKINDLLCIYIIFILEIFVTIKDLQYVNCVKSIGKEIKKLVLSVIIPDVIITLFVFILYYYFGRKYLIGFFVLLSAVLKYLEVYLVNNADELFNTKNNVGKDNNLTPKPLY